MSARKTAIHLRLDSGDYVILPRRQYEQLTLLAKAAELPPLPKRDTDGNYPAVEYARASLARKMIRMRVEAGLSQQALADLAGVRVETICRVEKGHNIPSVPTIAKIERALKAHEGRTRKRKRA